MRTVFMVYLVYSTPYWAGFWGEVFSLPIKVPIYLPRKDERFGKPWRGLNSQHYDYKRVALSTELSLLNIRMIFKIFTFHHVYRILQTRPGDSSRSKSLIIKPLSVQSATVFYFI